MNNRIKTGIEIRPELKARLYATAASRGIKLYEAIEQAVVAYLGEKDEGKRIQEVPSKYWPSMEKLAMILISGDRPVIGAVTANIDVFFDRLKPVKPAASKAKRQDEGASGER